MRLHNQVRHSLGHSAARLAVKIIGLIIIFTTSTIGQTHSNRQHDVSKQLFIESTHLLGGIRNSVVRWRQNIHIALINDSDQNLLIYIESIFRELSLLTGINYRLINHDLSSSQEYLSKIQKNAPYDLSLCDYMIKDHCANFVIIVADQKTMHEIAKALPMRPIYQKATGISQNITCFFSPGFSNNFEISRSIVYVRKSLSRAMLQTCLNEEIIQSFGIFGDYTGSKFFSFNNEVQVKTITNFDKALLSSLYDLGYRPGTSSAPIAKQFSDYCSTDCIFSNIDR